MHVGDLIAGECVHNLIIVDFECEIARPTHFLPHLKFNHHLHVYSTHYSLKLWQAVYDSQ